MRSRLSAVAALLTATTLAGGLLSSTPALAQSAAQLQSIEDQIRALQSQLKQMKADLARRDAALKQAQDDAAQARAAAAAAPPVPPALLAAPPGSYPVVIPKYDPDKPNGTFSLGGVTVTFGGFIDLTALYRTNNETRGTATSFASIPFQNSPSSHIGEYRMTAQQTRLSVMAQGRPDDDSVLTAYVEGDFNNAAGGTNSVQSSGYTPRLRQAYVTYQYDPWNTYVLGGQTWSLATLFRNGLTPRTEFVPTTIDTAYIPGVTYLRVPALRVASSFNAAGQKISLGLELDDPQTVFGGTAYSPTGTTITYQAAGAGGLNPQTNYSYNVAPDIIGKGAIDTAFGHYELYGIGRFFADRVSVVGSGSNNVTFGGGVGAAMYIPVKKWFDVVGNILYGYGIGRYGAGGLPDVTFNKDGSLSPLREVMGYIGIIGHVTPKVDVYGYYGIDQIGSKFFNVKNASYGYGNPGFSNAGCNIEASTLPCIGNNYQLTAATVGFTWRLLKGKFGTLAAGLQYGYYVRDAYRGAGVAPSAYENEVMANIRYTPFN